MGSSDPPDNRSLHHTPDACDEEYSLPCAEAVLAGTLALMTGYMQACGGPQRDAMRHRITAGLQDVARSGQFTPQFCALLGSLQRRWAQPCGLAPAQTPSTAALSAAEQRRTLWLPAPEALQ